MSLYLRQAQREDCDMLFEWANEKAVRKNSFCTSEIAYGDHVKWFTNLLSDQGRKQLIMELQEGDNRIAVGQVRLTFDKEKSQAEIGYSIDKSYRGRGYGKKLLILTTEYIKKNYPMTQSIVGKVKTNNIASEKVFLKSGFYEEYRCYKWQVE